MATIHQLFPPTSGAVVAQTRRYLAQFEALAKSDLPPTECWEDIWRVAATRAREMYLADPARMRLLLGPDYPFEARADGRRCVAEMGDVLSRAFRRQQNAPNAARIARVCVRATDINGMFWRSSFLRTGTITDFYFEEGMRASLAYLRM